jgi:tetratricopeptide (TPR) repeat protein
LRVPLIVSNPKLFSKAQVVSDRVVGLVDVVPTLLSMLALEPTHPLDGEPLLRDDPDPDREIYSETFVSLYNLRVRLSKRGLDPASPGLAPQERELDPQDEQWLAQLGYSRSNSGGQPITRADPKVAIRTWVKLSNAANLAQRGDPSRALEIVEQVLETSPRDLYALEVGFQAASFAREDARAESYMLRRLEEFPTPDLLARLGSLYVRMGRPQDGLQAVEGALKIHPDHGELLVVKGQCLSKLGRDDEARALYRRALEVDPIRGSRMAREELSKFKVENPGSY